MMTPKRRQAALFTIGYEGKTPREYLGQLKEAGVTLLCDVRANPLSRKKGFSKRALAEACAAEGIRYEHLRELGIPSANRKNLRTPEQKRALFARYARETLPRRGEALGRIRGWMTGEGERVALTCFEREACECHRHCIADLLAREGVGPAVNL